MPTSQNGYKACDPALIGKYTVPGTKVTINLRKGDVSVVLLDFAAWYHKNIEALTQADTGGYNCREIEGSDTVSNHGSGTAEDLRWNEHPRGAHGTFTTAQKTKIHKKLGEYAGVIRWGEDYSGVIDGMHYEINKGPAAVKVQADRIRAKGVTSMVDITPSDANGNAILNRALVPISGGSPITALSALNKAAVTKDRATELTVGASAPIPAHMLGDGRSFYQRWADLETLLDGLVTDVATLTATVENMAAVIAKIDLDPADEPPQQNPIVIATRYAIANP